MNNMKYDPSKVDKVVKFFSYVVKENVQGIQALLGRDDLLYEDAVLQGYELAVIAAGDVNNKVIKGSPLKISARELILKTFSPDYELYVIRANPKKKVPGKIWYISPEEYEILRDYEYIDYGMQEDIVAKARTKNGDFVTVNTYGLIKDAHKIKKLIKPDYIRENIPTAQKLALKAKSRKEFLARKKAMI